MPGDRVYMLTALEYDRLGRLLRWAESVMSEPMRRDAGPNQGQESYTVRVTSSTADANGHYSGLITSWEEVEGEWRDWGTTVKVRCPNGEQLVEDVEYECKPIGQATLSATTYDLYQLDPGAGRMAVVVTPSGGIPALATIGGRMIPGHAICDVYRQQTINGARYLLPAGSSIRVCNLSTEDIGGNLPLTAEQDLWGEDWYAAEQGIEFAECDTGSSGGSSGSGAHGGEGGDCSIGNCGDPSVNSTLTATITDKTGCYTTLPDTLTFHCVNVSGGHVWNADVTVNDCGTMATWEIGAAGHPSGEFTLDLSINGAGPFEAENGFTCLPLGATFFVDNAAGSTCTVTVVGS